MALTAPDANILQLLTPAQWRWWRTGQVDASCFAGKPCSTPGYLLPLDCMASVFPYFFSLAQSWSSASRVKCDSLTPVSYWQVSQNT